MEAFDPSKLQEPQHHLFYLDDEELAELADSVWTVRGVELPVHSQIVSQKSRVLRDAYKEVRCASTGPAVQPDTYLITLRMWS